MFKADDYRLKIQGMRATLSEAGYALDLENQRIKLTELKAEQEKPEVWQDLEKSTKIGREVSHIQNKIDAYEKSENALFTALSPDFVLWGIFLHIRKTLNPLWIKRFLIGGISRARTYDLHDVNVAL